MAQIPKALLAAEQWLQASFSEQIHVAHRRVYHTHHWNWSKAPYEPVWGNAGMQGSEKRCAKKYGWITIDPGQDYMRIRWNPF